MPAAPDEALPVNVSTSVAGVVESFAADLRATLPDLVDGVYLIGSVALGDFHPGSSDVDFVAILRDEPDREALTRIADVHERVAARGDKPRLEGCYLRWADLQAPPDRFETLGIRAHGGVVHAGPNWVPPAIVWHELASHAVPVLGDSLDTREIALDYVGLRQWCVQALSQDWTQWWYRSASLFSRAGFGALGSLAPATGVLAVTRLHYILSTGNVTSKCGAGEWALQVCEPQWRRLIEECLRIRNRPQQTSSYRSAFARRRDALTYMDLMMTLDEETYGEPEPEPDHDGPDA